ncbi:MAG: 4-(cytidine 5'-diphospho)-2-C-methyl-D-erythritol kinase [Thiomargarita sp.]|nr:4-(cytidine 5'-diphospho)-2-C-methyl-D-erythritol kinase [Thiomargarita sp.]
MVSTTSLAPAKLNLFLHITSRRADGYHCLQTIFQIIDYCDILHFTIRNDAQLLCHYDTVDIPSEQDLVLKAANSLREYSGNQSLGISIEVEKKIPIGGGLGGGSSDAATTLLTLNKIWQLNLSYAILNQIGLKLGADVPVFIQGHTAWAEGIGEQLSPIKLDEKWYLIIKPDCQVSTAEIFNAKNLTRDTLTVNINNYLAGTTKNVFEDIVLERYPAIKVTFDWLQQYKKAHLTGTGACLFAEFNNQQEANIILNKLPIQWHGFVAQGKQISPVL